MTGKINGLLAFFIFLVMLLFVAGIAEGLSKHGFCVAHCTTIVGK